MVVSNKADKLDKIEAVREAVLKCRSTTRAATTEPTPSNHIEDDHALENVWTLLAELERSIINDE